MFCSKCGKENAGTAKFCITCGETLIIDSKVKGKKKYLWIIGLMVCGVLIAGLCFGFVKKSSVKLNDINDGAVAENLKGDVTPEDQFEQNVTFTDFAGNSFINLWSGGLVVGNKEDVYFYEGGGTYHLNEEGNKKLICEVDAQPDNIYLQLYGDALFFWTKDYIMRVSTDGGKPEKVVETPFSNFRVDKGYLYYVTTTVMYDDSAPKCVNRYNIQTKEIEQVLCEEMDWVAWLGKYDSDSEEILMYEYREKTYQEKSDEHGGYITCYEGGYFDVKKTDLGDVTAVKTFEAPYASDTDQNRFIKTEDYIYLVGTPLSSEGYVKEASLPAVFLESEWEEILAKCGEETSEAVLLADSYKKYDINNLSTKDSDKKEELLERYPIMETQVVYILRDTTQDAIRKRIYEMLSNAGCDVDAMIRIGQERDKAVEKESVKEKFVLECINPMTMDVLYRLEDDVYIRDILSVYKNDLIVYACVNDEVGVYRIREHSLRDCAKGSELSAELIFGIDTDISHMNECSMYMNVLDDNLYYMYHRNDKDVALEGNLYRVRMDGTDWEDI